MIWKNKFLWRRALLMHPQWQSNSLPLKRSLGKVLQGATGYVAIISESIISTHLHSAQILQYISNLTVSSQIGLSAVSVVRLRALPSQMSSTSNWLSIILLEIGLNTSVIFGCLWSLARCLRRLSNHSGNGIRGTGLGTFWSAAGMVIIFWIVPPTRSM